MREQRGKGRRGPHGVGVVLLGLGVGMGVGAIPLEPAAAQGRIAIRRSGPDSATVRDSAFRLMVQLSPDGLIRMIGELLASRELEERIAMELRGERDDGQRARDLESRLQSIVRRNSGLVSAIRLQCATEELQQPEGYIGINFNDVEVRRLGRGPTLYHIGEHPTIVSVEPGSPAQRAGLVAEDVVVRIAGTDVKQPIALRTLLKPGARIPLRVLRDGEQHDVTVLVAKRPDEYGSPCATLDELPALKLLPQAAWKRSEDGRASTGLLPRTPSPEPTGRGGFSYSFFAPYPMAGANLIAGASFVPIDDDWRETLGVDRGLLVMSVAPGSPAQGAGLRKSDVVLAVGDVQVVRVADLWRAVNAAGPDGVTLKVQRGRKEVVVVLKGSR